MDQDRGGEPAVIRWTEDPAALLPGWGYADWRPSDLRSGSWGDAGPTGG